MIWKRLENFIHFIQFCRLLLELKTYDSDVKFIEEIPSESIKVVGLRDQKFKKNESINNFLALNK